MFKSKIFKVAYAISQAEGWLVAAVSPQLPNGSISFHNHNPGNLTASVYQESISGGKSVFENDLVGFYAIVHQLYLYASGKSAIVPPVDTIYEAMQHYTGLASGSQELNNYVSIIEKVGGVLRTDKISTLIS